jgi:uncharacterized membrane protein
MDGLPVSKEDQSTETARYWEIDALRGVAMILMTAFHLTWDLVFFGLVNVNMFRPPWPQFSQIIATMFLSLAGVSLVISDNRAGKTQGFRKYLLRGLKVFGFGMIITLVTYLFVRSQFVVFGILHLIGFSIVAAYPFLPRRRWWISLIAGLALIAVGLYVNRQVTLSPWWIWLGINQLGRSMADWYPVLPWYGLVLVCIPVGHALYPGGRRRLALPDWSGIPVIRKLSFLGRHALLFYLVHQPILIGILSGISAVLPTR